ncbi:MAG: putative N-acetyltransferase YafP [Nitrospirales bacterium]|nr:MAG: putative N-acetyltransferase YafP [Nitrospirales bacterium]
MDTMRIQPYEYTDSVVLGDIYRTAILTAGQEYYSDEQVTAWASYPDDKDEFARWVQEASTVVAIAEHLGPVGFGGLEKTGRIASLFVRPEYMRQGVASALLKRLMSEAESQGMRELTTQASEFSKPLFEKFGFEVTNIERTTFKNVDFTRYVMRKYQ